MKRIVSIMTLALVAASACRDGAEPWLAGLQARILAEPPTNPPSQILRFDYGGSTVYYRPPYCCDIQGVLYAADGSVLCHPDGGITGRGDGRCPDFFAARSACEQVWTDPRAKRVPDGCAAAAPVR